MLFLIESSKRRQKILLNIIAWYNNAKTVLLNALFDKIISYCHHNDYVSADFLCDLSALMKALPLWLISYVTVIAKMLR